VIVDHEADEEHHGKTYTVKRTTEHFVYFIETDKKKKPQFLRKPIPSQDI
jgi:hypothetical protein